MRTCFHHVISTSDLLTLIVGAIVSFSGFTGPSGSSLLQAASNPAAVHREIVLTAVEASGAIAVIVFTLAGMTVEVVVVAAIGVKVLAAIHVLTSTFLTALFVFSKNLLDLLEFALDSLIQFTLLVISDILYVLKLLLVH